ncbi:hypothetical protein HYU95_04690 [Candidatus Daviesbacteria bacterium]|nr:hypothetical protein [Candidatus Daviesbacteria bacterium]
MQKTEQDSGYQNKHFKSIHLDTYRGIASDIMELNRPVADGFMKTSDMRGDVVIMQKPQDRVWDYDEIGFVRVAKLLKLPRLNFWRNGTGFIQTKKSEGVWYIAINDQELANKVVRAEDNSRKFDERFVDAFKEEVKRGLVTCLKREKLLNGGQYNFAFLVGYHGLISYNLVAGPSILAAAFISGEASLVASALAFSSIANAASNGINLFGAGLTHVEQRLFGDVFKGNTPDFNDPFVKHSLFELIMPPVPIDRLILGLRYLNKHSHELIKTIK